ncbi:MAG: hypothetical protein GY815_02935 [Gammaproteobacteria bacterium]|nr:hypothetical protein [Gammaproteobacteria bacterium]
MASIIRSPRFGRRARRLSVRGSSENAPGNQTGPVLADNDRNAPEIDIAADPVAQLESDNALLRRQLAESGARADRLETELEALRLEIERQDESKDYQLGLESGREEAQAGLKAERESMTAVLESIHEQGQQYLQQLEETNVEVIFAAVSKMVARVAGDADYLRDLVSEQLKQVKSPDSVVVRVAPADHQALTGQEDAGANNLTGSLRFVPDDHIQFGGCIVEAERGGLDARLEIQLQQFKEMLLDVYNRRQLGDR